MFEYNEVFKGFEGLSSCGSKVSVKFDDNLLLLNVKSGRYITTPLGKERLYSTITLDKSKAQ